MSYIISSNDRYTGARYLVRGYEAVNRKPRVPYFQPSLRFYAVFRGENERFSRSFYELERASRTQEDSFPDDDCAP